MGRRRDDDYDPYDGAANTFECWIEGRVLRDARGFVKGRGEGCAGREARCRFCPFFHHLTDAPASLKSKIGGQP
jgi:hypothetical protein